MKNDFPKKLIKAEQYLKGSKDIAFAYLFGSCAKDTVTALSDVDIAVYLRSEKTSDKRLEIIGDLVNIFKTDRLDLVILNTASLSLKMRIMKARKVMADNLPFIRHAFESTTIRTGLDFSKIEDRILEERYLHG
jgi:predicted nucleotidyltransferase